MASKIKLFAGNRTFYSSRAMLRDAKTRTKNRILDRMAPAWTRGKRNITEANRASVIREELVKAKRIERGRLKAMKKHGSLGSYLRAKSLRHIAKEKAVKTVAAGRVIRSRPTVARSVKLKKAKFPVPGGSVNRNKERWDRAVQDFSTKKRLAKSKNRPDVAGGIARKERTGQQHAAAQLRKSKERDLAKNQALSSGEAKRRRIRSAQETTIDRRLGADEKRARTVARQHGTYDRRSERSLLRSKKDKPGMKERRTFRRRERREFRTAQNSYRRRANNAEFDATYRGRGRPYDLSKKDAPSKIKVIKDTPRGQDPYLLEEGSAARKSYERKRRREELKPGSRTYGLYDDDQRVLMKDRRTARRGKRRELRTAQNEYRREIGKERFDLIYRGKGRPYDLSKKASPFMSAFNDELSNIQGEP